MVLSFCQFSISGHDLASNEGEYRLNRSREQTFQFTYSLWQLAIMENYSGLLPFLWKTFKTKPQERKRAPEMQPLSMPHMILEDHEDVSHNQDDAYFLHPELVGKSPSRFAKSPSIFGRSPGRSSPGRTHRRRHSTGLSGFSLSKMLSSSPQRAR